MRLNECAVYDTKEQTELLYVRQFDALSRSS